MTTFRYTAIGAGGERLAGLMEAATEAEVIVRLQRQGSMPVRAEPADKASRWAGLLQMDLRWPARAAQAGRRRPDPRTGDDADRRAGSGPGASLHAGDRPAARYGRPSPGLRDAVRDGSPLSVAMARYPATFPAMHVGLVRAGEAGGNLGPTLARIADLLDRQRALASTVTSALIYPAVLFVAMIGAVTLLLTEVLPQFVPMFEQSGVALPASTQFLIAAGNFVQEDGLFLLLAILVLIVADSDLRCDRHAASDRRSHRAAPAGDRRV